MEGLELQGLLRGLGPVDELLEGARGAFIGKPVDDRAREVFAQRGGELIQALSVRNDRNAVVAAADDQLGELVVSLPGRGASVRGDLRVHREAVTDPPSCSTKPLVRVA